ncbi:MAG TPA: TRAP transporter substrate-binding protein DctP [Longimicrobiales bacterium]|nr:TRAP transporter substrate-binding protein DctP [Longimicrobiales bacterium]
MTIARRDFLKAGAGAAGLGTLWACGAPQAGTAGQAGAVSGPRVSWRMQTSFTPNLDLLHGSGVRIGERVAELTGGNFQIRVYAAGEIVPGLQVMDAVMQGTLQCGLTSGYYYIGKHPALAFDTAIPFGMTTRQTLAWLHHGGGLDAINGIYADFGILSIPATTTGGQMGGWFRRPVGSLAELSGLRMRIPGIGGEIMARLGVTVQTLAAPEIFPAMERGAIDAVEWVGPYDDETMGLHEVASYYYYPGWWEPGVTVGLLIARAAYDELPPAYQQALWTACGESFCNALAAYDAANPPALQRLVQEHGVTVERYSDDIMEAAWRESHAYLDELASANPEFRDIWQSYRAFRDMQWAFADGNELAYQRWVLERRSA